MGTNRPGYDAQYAKANLKRIPLNVRKDYYENVIKQIPETTGYAVNTFIKLAITEKIQRDHVNLPINEYHP